MTEQNPLYDKLSDEAKKVMKEMGLELAPKPIPAEERFFIDSIYPAFTMNDPKVTYDIDYTKHYKATLAFDVLNRKTNVWGMLTVHLSIHDELTKEEAKNELAENAPTFTFDYEDAMDFTEDAICLSRLLQEEVYYINHFIGQTLLELHRECYQLTKEEMKTLIESYGEIEDEEHDYDGDYYHEMTDEEKFCHDEMMSRD